MRGLCPQPIAVRESEEATETKIRIGRDGAPPGHDLADTLGRALGVSRQRVKEIMESGNLKIETMVRVAAACGYELSISLHPVNPDRPVLGAVISADRA